MEPSLGAIAGHPKGAGLKRKTLERLNFLRTRKAEGGANATGTSAMPVPRPGDNAGIGLDYHQAGPDPAWGTL